MSLVDLTLNEFVKQLGSDSPAPGGGSVAALAGSLSAALCAMVARLTVGKKKYQDAWKDMEKVRDEAEELSRRLLELVDRDTEAYNQVMMAFRLPKDDDEQKSLRTKAIEAANKQAAAVPLETLRTVAELGAFVDQALEKGNPNCVTDAGVAAQMIRTGAMGAAYNVKINFAGIKDLEFTDRLEKETNDLLDRVFTSVEALEQKVELALNRS